MFIHSAVIFIAESRNIENKFIEDYCIDWRIYQRLSKGNCNRGLLVAFRGQFSDTAFVYQLRPTLLEWRWRQLKLIQWHVVKKGPISLSLSVPSSVSKKILAENMERWCCTNNKCKNYIQCDETREIFGGNVTHSHDKDSEASLSRQILNNSIKRKAMEDLWERPRKLIHKELQSQDFNTLTCKDRQNIWRNIHKVRSSQLPPLQKILKKLMKPWVLYKC
jgi:hypothetical protein